MERIVTLQELKELRARILSSAVSEEEKRAILSLLGINPNVSSSSNTEKGKAFVKKNPSAPSLLDDTPNFLDKTDFRMLFIWQPFPLFVKFSF